MHNNLCPNMELGFSLSPPELVAFTPTLLIAGCCGADCSPRSLWLQMKPPPPPKKKYLPSELKSHQLLGCFFQKTDHFRGGCLMTSHACKIWWNYSDAKKKDLSSCAWERAETSSSTLQSWLRSDNVVRVAECPPSSTGVTPLSAWSFY